MAANFLGLVTFALGLLLVVQLTSCDAQPWCSRIKAAFYMNRQMQLVIGDELVTLDEDNLITATVPVSQLKFNHDITAAIADENASKFFLFSGSTKEGFTAIGVPSTQPSNFMSNADIDGAFKDEPNFKGIDAALAINRDAYLFAGCSYITINMDDPTKVGGRADNSKLGLPCNVDAALFSSSDRKPVVIKGNKVWKFRSGPFSGFTDPSTVEEVFWGLSAYTICAA